MGHEAFSLDRRPPFAEGMARSHMHLVAARGRRPRRGEPVGEEILVLGVDEEDSGDHEPRLLSADGARRNFAGLPRILVERLPEGPVSGAADND